METSSGIKDFCRSSGADLCGIADLAAFKDGWPVIPPDLLRQYAYAVSIAVKLDNAVIDAISDRPSAIYLDHYKTANNDLDRIAEAAAQWIRSIGHKAEAVPASKILDIENLLGAVSHKAIARMAGIGWQGKSLLIVSPEYGPRIRLATVLTDMPLAPDGPVKNRCGSCLECTNACPVGAIRNTAACGRYSDREEALIFERCVNRTYENSLLPGIGARICGICVKACPNGRPRRNPD